ncbi:MAG: hypothetical protein HZA90_12115 [Verrucomicrobia bacterium]|nr:hypothetical protein [Verrucomicrobiota bacterium]
MKSDPHGLLAASSPRTQRESRRAFLRTCARYPALAGLAVVGGWLALRKGDPSDGEPCVKQRLCRGCSLFDNCERPQAMTTRKATS